MNEKDRHIERLISLFLSGDTSLEQERELSEYFANATNVPPQWEPVRQMMAYFDQGMPRRKRPAPRRVIITALVRAAAVAAAILTVFLAARWILNTPRAATEPQAPVYAGGDSHKSDSVSLPADTVPVAMPISDSEPQKMHLADKTKRKPHTAAKHRERPKSAPIDSGVVRAEQGQIELAMQELTADRIITEQERRQLHHDREVTIAIARDSHDEIKRLSPRPVPVVFK